MPRTLYIIRHGNTFAPGDIVRRIGRRTDVPLTASGLEQAETLAQYFVLQGVEFSKIFCAPLQRTLQTANAIALAQPGPLVPVPYPDLSEIDYGPDENKPETEVIERLGIEALRLWNEQSIPPQGWKINPGALAQAWCGLFKKIADEERRGTVVVAVTSNGVARFALDAARSDNSKLPKKLRTGAFGQVAIDNQGNALVEQWDVRP